MRTHENSDLSRVLEELEEIVDDSERLARFEVNMDVEHQGWGEIPELVLVTESDEDAPFWATERKSGGFQFVREILDGGEF